MFKHSATPGETLGSPYASLLGRYFGGVAEQEAPGQQPGVIAAWVEPGLGQEGAN